MAKHSGPSGTMTIGGREIALDHVRALLGLPWPMIVPCGEAQTCP